MYHDPLDYGYTYIIGTEIRLCIIVKVYLKFKFTFAGSLVQRFYNVTSYRRTGIPTMFKGLMLSFSSLVFSNYLI